MEKITSALYNEFNHCGQGDEGGSSGGTDWENDGSFLCFILPFPFAIHKNVFEEIELLYLCFIHINGEHIHRQLQNS